MTGLFGAPGLDLEYGAAASRDAARAAAEASVAIIGGTVVLPSPEGTAGLVNRTVRSRAKRSRPKRVDARPGETPESGEAGTLVDPVGI
jgi:hypothetical protein